MMDTKELRIGNWVNSIAMGLRGGYGIVRGIEGEGALIMLKQGHLKPLASEVLCGISLTEEILIKAGFEKLPHFTIGNNLIYGLGRGRQLSVSGVGTPNEFVYLSCVEDKTVTDAVCIHNYDYDGPLTLHRLQNIVYDTGGELTIDLC